MASVYVGTSLFNAAKAKEVIDRFRKNDICVSYDWTTHGQIFSEAELQQYADEEIRGVKTADLFFMVSPARNGTHIELGLAIAYNKPAVLVLDPDVELKTFYFAPNVFRFTSLDEAFTFALEKLKS